MVGAVCAVAFGMYRSYGVTKVSDGELLGAWLTLAFCFLKASAHDPLTSRVIGYTMDLRLVVTACAVLQAAGWLPRLSSFVPQWPTLAPRLTLMSIRVVTFRFFHRSHQIWIWRLCQRRVQWHTSRCSRALTCVRSLSLRWFLLRQGWSKESYCLGAALAAFKDATSPEHLDVSTTVEGFFALVYFNSSSIGLLTFLLIMAYIFEIPKSIGVSDASISHLASQARATGATNGSTKVAAVFFSISMFVYRMVKIQIFSRALRFCMIVPRKSLQCKSLWSKTLGKEHNSAVYGWGIQNIFCGPNRERWI